MFRHLAIVIAALAVGIDADSRIINGNYDTIENRPYMVSLHYDGRLQCGGSIISKSYILTAGHCISWNRSLDSLLVRSGSSFKGREGSLSHVEALFQHPKFAGYKLNDIALLKLKEPLVFDDTRQPIELFEANEKVKVGAKAVVSGWGQTKEAEWSGQLQSVVVPIVDISLCAKSYKLNPGNICAGYYDKGGKDACKRDSGGPLVVDGRQVGIVSWGTLCAQPKKPGVYTEVAYFRKWIDNYIAEDV